MNKIEEALKLVSEAFGVAQSNCHKPIQMSLVKLKERLHSLTEGNFCTEDYDARTIQDFADGLSPYLTKVEGNSRNYFFNSSLYSDEEKSKPLKESDFSIKDILYGRIREDLWCAAVDYASGRTYVWDTTKNLAREINHGENYPIIPTLTFDDLSHLRKKFLNDVSSGLSASDLAVAQRWQEQGLGTNYLPDSLKANWNREHSKHVRKSLTTFFEEINKPVSAKVSITEDLDKDHIIDLARDKGDMFGAGLLCIYKAIEINDADSERYLVKALIYWNYPSGLKENPKSFKDLFKTSVFSPEPKIVMSFINILAILGEESENDNLRDSMHWFAYKIRSPLNDILANEEQSPEKLINSAKSYFDEFFSNSHKAVLRFQKSTPIIARTSSTDLLKELSKIKKILIGDDANMIANLTILLGSAFRNLFNSYENADDADVIRRSPEYLRNVHQQQLGNDDNQQKSRIWQKLVKPVLDHIVSLVEEASLRGENALAPNLELRNPHTKANILSSGTEIQISLSLLNSGKGPAQSISLLDLDKQWNLRCVAPSNSFMILAGKEESLTISLKLSCPVSSVKIPVVWRCITAAGKTLDFNETIHIDQQKVIPDWERLMENSPYGTNPVNNPENLYGRSGTLSALRQAAMSRTSHFVWGQKRIGKTSLLQVLNGQLDNYNNAVCILLRMGEISSLHEGQIAHKIASRLSEKISYGKVPSEADFGAGLGPLVPFVDELVRNNPEKKFVVIIDEFDDLDPALYTGERGKQFIKALRSSSEAGLTFFFVGSERMDEIFIRHQSDLNKWINERLDKISNQEDCNALIKHPLDGYIEFSSNAVDFIIDFADGNPFYMNLFCFHLMQKCMKEHRTYIDVNDAYSIRKQLSNSLGAANFSHFWEDNPVIDEYEKTIQSGENCIAICCIAQLGGRYESIDEVIEAQNTIDLPMEDRANEKTLRNACLRLVKRKILSKSSNGDIWTITLPIFREWVAANSISHLLPIWQSAKLLKKPKHEQSKRTRTIKYDSSFIIPEEEILSVSQNLVFLGKQKDVAEIRLWLRQFDDDNRIEMAFTLLKRVAEKGFITEGARSHGYQRMVEIINNKRAAIGKKKWNVIKGKNDNLAISYVDSDHKSGATTAREVNRLSKAGKVAPAVEINSWIVNHRDDDPILVIADDFSGTGSTIVKGLNKMKDKITDENWNFYLSEGRLIVVLMYAFVDAINHIKSSFPNIEVIASKVLDDELLFSKKQSKIFATDDERLFAIQVLTQIGRELSPKYPLGHGDMGALVIMHNTTPNNSLPIFWCNGTVAEKDWVALFPRS